MRPRFSAGGVGFIVLFSAMVFLPAEGHAQKTTYDRYAPIYKDTQTPSQRSNVFKHFLVYPFEIVRWPVDQALVYIEDYHIDKKARWAYDALVDYGVTPHLNMVNPLKGSYGADLDFSRVVNQKEHFPDGIADGWIHYAGDNLFEVGSRIGMERIADTGFCGEGLVRYEDRHLEHFYGIGPHASRGDGYVYEMEATTLEVSAGYNPTPVWDTGLRFAYQNINISGGKDGGRGQIGEGIFAEGLVPGLRGDSLLTFGAELKYDTRNQKENSTKGGLHRFAFSYHEGLDKDGPEAGYFTYQAELSRYLALGSERRVLAVRFYGEHNDETGNDYVPFHQMVQLGGFGSYPHFSHTLRGFDDNRFRDESAVLLNVEYRYNIWEYRELKLDTTFFWDEGQVFGEFSDFQFKDFRESYGIGFRLSLAKVMVFTVQMGMGDEGVNLYVKTSTPF